MQERINRINEEIKYISEEFNTANQLKSEYVALSNHKTVTY